MPVYSGSVGPDVVDIQKLYGQTSMFTYDPGFLSTAACQSTITYIDGDRAGAVPRLPHWLNWRPSATTWIRATCC